MRQFLRHGQFLAKGTRMDWTGLLLFLSLLDTCSFSDIVAVVATGHLQTFSGDETFFVWGQLKNKDKTNIFPGPVELFVELLDCWSVGLLIAVEHLQKFLLLLDTCKNLTFCFTFYFTLSGTPALKVKSQLKKIKVFKGFN